jgi:glucose/arabinose dehydrogenase
VKYIITLIISFLVLSGCQKETLDQDSYTPFLESKESNIDNNIISGWVLEASGNHVNNSSNVAMIGNLTIMTEVSGNIVMIGDGSLKKYNVQTTDPIVQAGESGVLGLALADNFVESGIAYLYYTYSSDSGLANKVVQLLFNGNSWKETKILVDNLPGLQFTNGRRVAIGPDGFLYVMTGWTKKEELSQDINSLTGKVLRMNLDGSIPDDNPNPESFEYLDGNNLPQGLTWDNDGKILYSSERSSSGDKETNVFKSENKSEIIGEQDKEMMIQEVLMNLHLLKKGN